MAKWPFATCAHWQAAMKEWPKKNAGQLQAHKRHTSHQRARAQAQCFGAPKPVAPLPRISQLLTPTPSPLSSRPPGYVSFLHKAERAVSSIAR